MPFTAGEIEQLVACQIGAANALATYAGAKLGHVKVHGALSNIAAEDEAIAQAVARAVKAVEPRLGFLGSLAARPSCYFRRTRTRRLETRLSAGL